MTAGDVEHAHPEDRALGSLLRERLPRHHAPAHLRAAVLRTAEGPAPSGTWLLSALSAVATVLLMVMVLIPVLPRIQPDPLQGVVRAVVSEHTRSLMWGEARPDEVRAVLPRLMEETGIGLSWFFIGDDQVRLLRVEAIYLDGRKGLAFFYQDPEGHLVSYLVLSSQELPVPERGRVQIDRFRPLLTKANGFALFVWKHRELTCFLVSDLVSEYDLSRFREYFLKVRATTDPFPIS